MLLTYFASFTGYEDDIFEGIQTCTFKDPTLAESLNNLAESLKNLAEKSF